jgi:hypothetical protein
VALVISLRGVQYLVLIALWLGSLALPRRTAQPEPERARGVVPFGPLLCVLALLAAGAALQFHLIALAAQQQVPLPAWRAALPLVPIDDSAPLFGHTAAWIGESSAGLALLQCALLATLYALARGRTFTRAGWLCIGIAAALMASAALLGTGLGSSDIYLYAGHGRLGLAAYAPPPVRFPGEFGAINDLRGVPIYPSLYGPLWLAVAAGVTSALHGLTAQLFGFRVLGLVLFVVCLILLRAMQQTPAILALFALNPAFYGQFVADAHNDVLPLAFTLGALWLAPRRPWLGLLLVVGAGATKLPFAIAGLVAFRAIASLKQRVTLAAIGLLGALAATFVASGGMYFSTSARMSARISREAFIVLTHDLAIALALAAALLALVFGRYLAGASWSFVSLSTTLFPWYVAWCVPYALAEETWLPVFLCTLPVATFLLSSVYALTPLTLLLYLLALGAPLVLVLRARRSVTPWP